MKIKFAIFIIPVFFAIFSCLDYSLPKQVTLEAEVSIGIPIKTATVNWGAVLADVLKDAFAGDIKEGIGVEIYNVNHGQNVQGFCVNIPMQISNPLNPNDYMEGIADKIKMDMKWNIDPVIAPSFDDFKFSYDVDDYDVNQDLPIPIPSGEDTFIVPRDASITIKIPETPKNLNYGDGFLHALIEEGHFNINMDLSQGNVILPDGQFTEEYNIIIVQEDDVPPYYGLSHPSTRLTLTSATQSLKGNNINRKQISISGTVTLRPTPGGGTIKITHPDQAPLLKGKVEITIDLTKFAELDWDSTAMSANLNPEPVSLADVKQYMNWIEFDECGVDPVTGEPTKGIGVDMYFEEIIPGLQMKIICGDLSINEGNQNPKPLIKGHNAFGNNEAMKLNKRLQLASPPVGPDAPYKVVSDLQFYITLSPAGGSNVLHLTNLTAGQTLIKGEARLFYFWESAEVNMTAALKLSKSASVYTGTFPKEDQDPIDLSMLDDYIPGFSIDVRQAAAYLSGPDGTINNDYVVNPRVLITALYSSIDPPGIPVIEKNQKDKIILEKKHVVFRTGDGDNTVYNPEYIKKTGSYISYIQNKLPPDGNDFMINFEQIINAPSRPKDLRFHYMMELPPTIVVTPEMFFDDKKQTVPHDIFANIIVLMYLSLKADNGGRIQYPDMFSDDPGDLFGRESLDDDSMFSLLNDVDYIRLAIDFAGDLFTGGNLFIERDSEKNKYKNNAVYTPVLFRDGIPLNGRRLAVDITGSKINTIRDTYPIIPDFWVEFKPGAAITIPRNMGLTSIKIEAKGRYKLDL